MPNHKDKKIWLVRHAESKAQTEEEYGYDTSLTEKGVKQAERLEQVFKDIVFDRIYISPLKRARETFEHSRIRGEVIEFDSRLVEELPPGSYSSILPYPELPKYGISDKHNAWLANARPRAVCFLGELKAAKARHILVMSHCGFFNHLLGAFLPEHGIQMYEDFKYCQMGNGGISVLYMGENISHDMLLCWNDVKHVKDLISADPLAPLKE